VILPGSLSPRRRPRHISQRYAAGTVFNKAVVARTTKEQFMSEDAKKPVNMRANAKPSDGYVLTVDGKLKVRYETAKDAAAEGAKLKQRFPVIQVAVYDAAENVYTPVALEDS
jgi:hypothetical protein